MQVINDPTQQSGTTADSNLKQERDALESKASGARDEAKQKAHQAYDDLRQGTRKIARESGSYIKKVVADQQHLLVEKLEEYRDAAKAASDKLESDDDTMASKNIRKAAGGLDCAADYVRESEPNDLLSDAGRIARKRPELVFGALFLAGLGVARVMKSSARERRSENHTNGAPPPAAGDSRPFSDSNPGNGPTPTQATAPPVPVAPTGE